MRIVVKGRNTPVTPELSERISRRFALVARQVSPLAELEVELHEERNPSIARRCVVEATLHVKGATLRAQERWHDMSGALNRCSEDLARQVKRDRDKRRRRREARVPRGLEASP